MRHARLASCRVKLPGAVEAQAGHQSCGVWCACAGTDPQAMVAALKQRQQDWVREQIAVLKRGLLDFHGFMLLFVSEFQAKPVVIIAQSCLQDM